LVFRKKLNKTGSCRQRVLTKRGFYRSSAHERGNSRSVYASPNEKENQPLGNRIERKSGLTERNADNLEGGIKPASEPGPNNRRVRSGEERERTRWVPSAPKNTKKGDLVEGKVKPEKRNDGAWRPAEVQPKGEHEKKKEVGRHPREGD